LRFQIQNKAASVFILNDQAAYVDGAGAFAHLDILGPAVDEDKKREVLARAVVRLLRGDFIPQLNDRNITGTTKFDRLVLERPSNGASSDVMTDEWLLKFADFARPILTDIFNAFLKTYAQYPVPLPNEFECASPEFTITARTMQVDCDILFKPVQNFTTVLVEKPTTVFVEKPTTMMVEKATSILIEKPTTVLAEKSTTMLVNNPTTLLVEKPTTLLVKKPTTILMEKPTTMFVEQKPTTSFPRAP
jgi:hypothetical protein